MSILPDIARNVTDAVLTEMDGEVLVVTINHPPVNALSVPVRQGLIDAMDLAQASSEVKAVIVRGQGRAFCGGADIREFGRVVSLGTRDVCARMENCTKPVVAAIHGVALGGGMEIALAAHHRIGTPNARLGLPEVSLGLLPGGGGTQRLPRLVGAKAALEIMLSARHVSAAEALALGLLDRLADDEEILAPALVYVRSLLRDAAPLRRTCQGEGLDDRARAEADIAAVREETNRKGRGLFAPGLIIDAVQAALDLPFAEGIETEKRLFQRCMDSPQRAGLVHAFFAEKDVVKVPEASRAKPLRIASVGVVGGGTMGAGIAVSLLDAGFPVTMVERDDEGLARGKHHIESVYASLIKRGRLTEEAANERLSRLSGSVDYASLHVADLVIEAVFEDMDVKHAVFGALDAVCKRSAILATNTSYLDVNAIAAAVSNPGRVIGLHFFSPANIMKLMEIVVPASASDETVATAFDVAKRLKKIAVRAGVCDGFIGNRLLAVYRAAADHMMEDGASPYQIDAAMREFGFAMGPFQVMDLAGGDIAWATRKRRATTRDPRTRYVQIADRLCERGWFGQKTGRGFYLYPDGARAGTEDPEVEEIIKAERARAGIAPRTFTNDEIVRRYLAAMINEGANVVDEGIALRPLDVDVTLVHGYGFPRHRGGPMHYAD
ncbi:MAG: 3-hydroxyacyl-CoA dehydrogenase NAD-binding domain-containing protein, partial [Janthinobacterium lividum]